MAKSSVQSGVAVKALGATLNSTEVDAQRLSNAVDGLSNKQLAAILANKKTIASLKNLSQAKRNLIFDTLNLTDAQRQQINETLAAAKANAMSSRQLERSLNTQLDDIRTDGAKQVGMRLGTAIATTAASALMNFMSSRGQAQNIGQAVGSGISGALMGGISGAMAGSMFGPIGMLVGGGIGAIAPLLGSLAGYFAGTNRRMQETILLSKELTEAFHHTQRTLRENASAARDLVGELATLSRGVDSNGRNIALTSAQYERFKEINQQLAALHPDMIAFYTAEGNAIVNLTGNVHEMNEALEVAIRQRQRLADLEFVRSDAGDILTGVLNSIRADEAAIDRLLNHRVVDPNQVLGNRVNFEPGTTTISIQDPIRAAQARQDLLDLLVDFEDGTLSGAITFTFDEREFEQRISEQRELIENRFQNEAGYIIPITLNIIPEFNELDASAQDNISRIGQLLNWREIIGDLDGDEAYVVVRAFLERLVRAINTASPEVQEAFSNLFNVRSLSLSAQEEFDRLAKYFELLPYQLQEVLSQDDNRIALELEIGFDIDTLRNQLIHQIGNISHIIDDVLSTMSHADITALLMSLADFDNYNIDIDTSSVEALVVSLERLREAQVETARAELIGQTWRDAEITLSQITEATEKWQNAQSDIERDFVQSDINSILSDWLDTIERIADEDLRSEMFVEYERVVAMAEAATTALASRIEDLADELTSAAQNAYNLQQALDQMSQASAIDAESMRTIIGLFPEAIAYANDFGMMYEFVSRKILELEDIAVWAYGSIVLQNESAINRIINTSSTLPGALANFYAIDGRNFAANSEGKFQVEAQTVARLSELWAQYARAGRASVQAQRDTVHRAISDTQTLIGKTNVNWEMQLRELDLVLSMFETMETDFAAIQPSLVRGGGGSGGSARQIEEYIALINELYAAEERLRTVQERRIRVEFNRDTAQYYEHRIRYMEQIVGLHRQEQQALHNLNQLRRNMIGHNVDVLRQRGFNIDYDARTNHLFIHNLEQINNITGANLEATNELRRAYEELVAETKNLNDANRSASGEWWNLQRSIIEARDAVYQEWMQGQRDTVSFMELQDVDRIEIINTWRLVMAGIHREIEYWTNRGYTEGSDRIRALTRDLEDVRYAIGNTLDAIVTSAMDGLGMMNRLYSDLLSAARDFAESGFLTVDNFKTIISHGVEFLHLLEDENGMLVINRENIHKIIAARVEQVATETALAYVMQIQHALQDGRIDQLNQLIFSTDTAVSSTWDLVYANVELARAMGLTDEQYQRVHQNLRNLRSLQDEAIRGIGMQSGELLNNLRDQDAALSDLLRHVMNMIRWEVRSRIDGIRQEIEGFRELINLRIEELRLMDRRRSFERAMQRQTRDLARLQSELAALERDNSGDPRILARRRELAEQIADMQGEVDEKIHQKYVEEQTRAYNEELRIFERTKNEQIRILEDSISSMEKVYQKALRRIRDEWHTLYRDLQIWTWEAGNTKQKYISEAWHLASLAVERYGSFLEAVLRTQEQLNALTNSMHVPTTVAHSGNFNTTPSSSAQQQVAQQQQQLKAQNKVNEMRANAQRWHGATAQEREQLNERNRLLATQLQSVIGRTVVRSPDGHWYLDRIGGQRLFDVFHEGGIVGRQPTIKENERISLLEKNEWVLTEPQKENAFKIIDASMFMMSRLGKIIDDFSPLASVPGRMSESILKSSSPDFSQGAVEDHNSSIHVDRIEIPVTVIPTEKLDSSDIQRFSGEIADITTNAITDRFRKNGKVNRNSTTQRIKLQ